MNAQPYIPLSVDDQLKAANALFDEKDAIGLHNAVTREARRKEFVRIYIEVEYKKLYEYTKALMEEMQD